MQKLRFSSSCYGRAFFFTVRASLGFLSGFDSLDAFLEFGFEGFLEEFSSFGEEEFVHVVEGLSIFGVVGDHVAFGEQGFEFGVEEFVHAGWRQFRIGHRYVRVKGEYQTV